MEKIYGILNMILLVDIKNVLPTPINNHINQYQGQHLNHYQNQYSQRNEFEPVECESSWTGLFAHPLDCTKFLKCDRGRTFLEECGPGAVFNDVLKVCDWPHNVNCGTRNQRTPNVQSGSKDLNHNPHLHHGEGDQSVDGNMAANSLYYRYHHHHHHPNHPHHPHYQFYPPYHPNPFHRHEYYQHHEHRNPPQSPTFITSVSSDVPQTDNIPLPIKPSLPPLRNSSLTKEYAPMNSQTNSKSNIHNRLNTNGNNETIKSSDMSEEHETVNESTSIHNIVFSHSSVPQNEPKLVLDFPELNYMTSRIGAEFYKYFSNPKPKSTLKLTSTSDNEDSLKSIRPKGVQTTADQLHDLNLLTLQVSDGFRRQFSTPKPQPLREIVNDSIQVSVNDRSNSIDKTRFHDNVQLSQFPEVNFMTSRIRNEFNKYFSNTKRKITPTPTLTPTMKIENYTELGNLPLKVFSQGGDIQLQSIDEEIDHNPNSKDELNLIHSEPIPIIKSYSPLDNYNTFYYQPYNQVSDNTKVANEMDYVPISENLKLLLRPYMVKNDNSKKKPTNVNTERFNNSTALKANINNRNQPNTSITFIRPTIQQTDYNVNRFRSNQSQFPPGFQHSPEFHSHNQQLNQPTEQSSHRQTTFDPDRIVFPGPHN